MNRKKSPRTKGGGKNPAAAEALRKKWQDPEYRAKQLALICKTRAQGKRFRNGIPDGMRREEAEQLWAQARLKAEFLMSEFEKEEMAEFPAASDIEKEQALRDGTYTEEEMARQTLKEAFVMALSPLTHSTVKMQAMRTILEYTKAKPAQKTDLRLNSAEAWLAEVVADHKASSDDGSES